MKPQQGTFSHLIDFSVADFCFLGLRGGDGVEPLEYQAGLLEFVSFAVAERPHLGQLAHVEPGLEAVQRVDDEDRGVRCLTREHIVVDRGNPEGAAKHIHRAVEVLVGIEAPGVAHAETLKNFTPVHANIGELTWKQVKHHEVHVVLLIQGEVISGDSEQMMNEVAHVEEPVPLHEYAVPYEVSRDVTESEYFESGVALRA